MPVSLVKGQNVSLEKGLTNVFVGLGWDVNKKGKETFDLDAMCFLLNGAGKLVTPKHRIPFPIPLPLSLPLPPPRHCVCRLPLYCLSW